MEKTALSGLPEKDYLMRILKSTPFFYDLSQSEFLGVSKNFKFHKFDTESTVIREGEKGGSLFFVVLGDLRVVIRKGGDSSKNYLLGKLIAGDFFGEHSLLTGSFRTASVVTITPSELIEIPWDVYQEFALKYHGVRRFLIDLCTQYQKRTSIALETLKLTRRQSHRHQLKGAVKFKEFDNEKKKPVSTPAIAGTLNNVSSGGVSFCVPRQQIGAESEIEQLRGRQFIVEMDIDQLRLPVNFLGELINCEIAISGRELADHYTVRMKYLGMDKIAKPVLLSFLNKKLEK